MRTSPRHQDECRRLASELVEVPLHEEHPKLGNKPAIQSPRHQTRCARPVGAAQHANQRSDLACTPVAINETICGPTAGQIWPLAPANANSKTEVELTPSQTPI